MSITMPHPSNFDRRLKEVVKQQNTAPPETPSAGRDAAEEEALIGRYLRLADIALASSNGDANSNGNGDHNSDSQDESAA